MRRRYASKGSSWIEVELEYMLTEVQAGVHHLMKNLGAFLVPFDIRTNIIAPGCKWISLVSGLTMLMTVLGFPTDMVRERPFSTDEESLFAFELKDQIVLTSDCGRPFR